MVDTFIFELFQTSIKKVNIPLHMMPFINSKEHTKKAQGYLQQAKDICATASCAYPGASELLTKQEIKLNILAAEHFRIAGEKHWIDSAHAYAQAAALAAGAMMDSEKSAELYAEAAIVMDRVDTELAKSYYRKLTSESPMHCIQRLSVLSFLNRKENPFRSTVTHHSTKRRHHSKSAWLPTRGRKTSNHL